jgi:hypothetical protein
VKPDAAHAELRGLSSVDQVMENNDDVQADQDLGSALYFLALGAEKIGVHAASFVQLAQQAASKAKLIPGLPGQESRGQGEGERGEREAAEDPHFRASGERDSQEDVLACSD